MFTSISKFIKDFTHVWNLYGYIFIQSIIGTFAKLINIWKKMPTASSWLIKKFIFKYFFVYNIICTVYGGDIARKTFNSFNPRSNPVIIIHQLPISSG